MLRTKLRARELLSGNYITIAAILLTCTISYVLISNIRNIVSYFSGYITSQYKNIFVLFCSLFAVVLSFLVIPSLKLGREKWFYSKSKGNKTNLKMFFSCFRKKFFRNIGVWLCMKVLWLFWTGITLSPAIIMASVTINNFKNGISFWIGISLIASTLIFALLGTAFLLIIIQRYFLVYYITVSSSIGIIKSIAISTKIMRNKCLKTLKFKLSFLPWLIPCFFILPIFYVWGYYKQSCACLAEEYMNFLSVKPKSIVYGA